MNTKTGQLSIYRPMRSNWKTQGFNENKACAKVDVNCRMIYPPKIIGKEGDSFCPPGYKNLYHLLGMKNHNGTDHACWNGEPIYFPVDADCKWWARNEVDNSGGIGLDIFSDRPIDIGELPKECGRLARDQYNGIYGVPSYGYEKEKVFVKFRFWHLKESLISDSRNNIAGKPEGYREIKVKLGDLIALGNSSGASSGSHLHWSLKIVANNSCTLDFDNGFAGACDFSKYYENIFVGDAVKIKKRALSAIELAKKVIFDVRYFIQKML